MRVLRDFMCDCGKQTEEFIDNSIKELECECGQKSKPMIGSISYFKIDGFRMDINSEQWAKSRISNSKRVNG